MPVIYLLDEKLKENQIYIFTHNARKIVNY